jgi:hypothetical protein
MSACGHNRARLLREAIGRQLHEFLARSIFAAADKRDTALASAIVFGAPSIVYSLRIERPQLD